MLDTLKVEVTDFQNTSFYSWFNTEGERVGRTIERTSKAAVNSKKIPDFRQDREWQQ